MAAKENGPPANAPGLPDSVESQGRRSLFAPEADSRFLSLLPATRRKARLKDITGILLLESS